MEENDENVTSFACQELQFHRAKETCAGASLPFEKRTPREPREHKTSARRKQSLLKRPVRSVWKIRLSDTAQTAASLRKYTKIMYENI